MPRLDSRTFNAAWMWSGVAFAAAAAFYLRDFLPTRILSSPPTKLPLPNSPFQPFMVTSINDFAKYLVIVAVIMALDVGVLWALQKMNRRTSTGSPDQGAKADSAEGTFEWRGERIFAAVTVGTFGVVGSFLSIFVFTIAALFVLRKVVS